METRQFLIFIYLLYDNSLKMRFYRSFCEISMNLTPIEEAYKLEKGAFNILSQIDQLEQNNVGL